MGKRDIESKSKVERENYILNFKNKSIMREMTKTEKLSQARMENEEIFNQGINTYILYVIHTLDYINSNNDIVEKENLKFEIQTNIDLLEEYKNELINLRGRCE